jgi:outer membrane protein assembly factor BamB
LRHSGGLPSHRFTGQVADEVKPPASFTKCWEQPAQANLSIAIASDGETAYFVDTERKLIAVDLATGGRTWSSDLAGDPVSNVIVAHSLVIVASQASAEKVVLRAVSRSTGITQWSADLPGTASVTLGSLNGKTVALSSNGTANAFQTERGVLIWSRSIGSAVTTEPFFLGKTLIVGTEQKDVLALGMTGGEPSVVTKLGASATAVFSLDGEDILIGDSRGSLQLTTLQGKKEWTFRNGARISSIAGYDSEYLATSHDNFLYKLTRGGNVEWKRRLSARIDKRPIIVGKSIIVSTVGDGSVYVLDAPSGKIVNRIETGEETSVQVAQGKAGFVIVSTKALLYYTSTGCSVTK